MKLRDYQVRFYDSVMHELETVQSTLAVAATGTGKTVSFGHIAKDWKRGRVLVMAHREELIMQNRDKITAITGDVPDMEMGEFRAARHGLLSPSNVIVTSVQTQNAGRKCSCMFGCDLCFDGHTRRMTRFDPEDFGLLIIDEAHHSTSPSYRRVIDYYRQNTRLKVLGVTATPDRHDEAALGQVFESVAFEYSINEAIEDGWLVPIHQEWVEVEGLDFSHISTRGGDLAPGELAAVMEEEQRIQGVTTPTIEIAGDRATLVFGASVAHAEKMAEIFNRHKPNCAICIHGKTPKDDRRRLLKEYSQGGYQFLTGCGVFLEGFDEPRIEVVACARPTKSRTVYAQIIGRGTRPIVPPDNSVSAEQRRESIGNSSKPFLTVLDFVGNSGRHKLISTADILGGTYEQVVIDAAVKRAKSKGGQSDMTAELIEAQKSADELEKQRRQKVIAKAKYTKTLISPFDLFDVKPSRERGWHKGKRPTSGQKKALRNFGVDDQSVARMSFWDASKMIDTLIKRIDGQKCSFKQARLLERYGQSVDVSFSEASAIIDRIAKNDWKPVS